MARRDDSAEHEQRYAEADDAFQDHPYPSFLNRVVLLTGVDKELLHKAIGDGFNSCQSLVADIRRAEGTPALDKLYADLAHNHATIGANCGLKVPQNNGQPTGFDDVSDYLNWIYEQGTKAADALKSAQIKSPAEKPPKSQLKTQSTADNRKKIQQRQPDNVDVRDLCKLLEKNKPRLKAKTKTEIGVAREYTKESVADCRDADNLLRQARRYPHLWK